MSERPTVEELKRIRNVAQFAASPVYDMLFAEIDALNQMIERLERELEELRATDIGQLNKARMRQIKEYSEKLAAAERQLMEQSQKIATLTLHQREDDKDRDVLEDRLEAAERQLQIAVKALPTIRRDADGSVWLQIENGVINLSALGPITSRSFIKYATLVENAIDDIQAAKEPK